MKRRKFILSAASVTAALSAVSRGAETAGAESVPAQSDSVQILTPDSPAYGSAIRVPNERVAKKPAVVARCTDEQGVVEAVAYGNAHDLPIAIKSGGHSFEGFCLNEGGLVIDVSGLKSRSLDSGSNLFAAGAGCRLKDAHDFLLPKGRLLPGGSCATVGLSGLALGGGYGFFARHFGLTCDHLTGVRLVDGTGRVRDSSDEPELLWACRGGGNGHFGVITEMRFRTQPAPEQLAAYRFRARKLQPEALPDRIEKWFDAAAGLPPEAFSAVVINPHSLFILVAAHGDRTDPALLGALNKIEGFMPDADPPSVQALARALPRYYSENDPPFSKNSSGGFYRNYEELRGVMPEIVSALGSAPGALLQINTMGGAIAQGEPSAYPHRDFAFLGEIQSYWEKAGQGQVRIAGVERIRNLLREAGVSRHYANYPDLGFEDWPVAYYGEENYARLRKIKRELDPANRIRHPQSVRIDA